MLSIGDGGRALFVSLVGDSSAHRTDFEDDLEGDLTEASSGTVDGDKIDGEMVDGDTIVNGDVLSTRLLMYES